MNVYIWVAKHPNCSPEVCTATSAGKLASERDDQLKNGWKIGPVKEVKIVATGLRGVKVKGHACDFCGSRTDVTRDTDPYASDLRGDHTLHWICEECQHTRAQEL
jgi:hypothetical protein